ncbi:LacI family DNA-binding transcriptional regulator [Variovorax sp.]|uniref:LacI family DNA-binding transcriptional regulator n=1 Tax=Variovorax sp. TaxID=1871043 RepID=UPI0025FF768C|nr:LacI family DNA-binding transcriptional regulator [Variovorax sp.]
MPRVQRFNLQDMARTTITLADIAAAAGVSVMTASRAVNNQPGVSSQTRDALLKVASELGYEGHRTASKSGTRPRLIGLIATRLNHPFVADIVGSVVETAAAAGIEVLVYSQGPPNRPPSVEVLQLMRQSTEGVVALLPYRLDLMIDMASERFPVVMIDSPGEPGELPCVAADSYGGARAAMKHLAELGHRRIAFVAGAEKLESALDRRRAYDDAIAVHGLERDPALVVPGEYDFEGGRAAARQLLALPRRPSAVFAANDLSAFGLMGVFQEHGLRIPEDVSVVGFDDVAAAAQVHPALTTVRQPLADMGRAAVSTLLAQIAGVDAGTTRVTLPAELIVRRSTAAPAR